MGYRLVQVFIEPYIYERLVEESIERGLNISDLVNEALREYFTKDQSAGRLSI